MVNTGPALLLTPLVTVATFKAHPTYLDLGNLRSGDTNTADQDAELYNQLLQASQRAEDDKCQQPLHAHLYQQNDRLRADRTGRLHVHAEHGPVRDVTALSYGVDLTSQVTVSAPPFRVRNNTNIEIQLGATGSTFTGALQFGAPAAWRDLDVQTTYVAGFTNALLANSPIAGATSIQVTDPTGVYPGDILRIWEPGKEESVIVASSWTPVAAWPPATATIPLASALVNAHTAGAGVSGAPADVITAVVYLVIDQLQRPGTTRSDQWPGKLKPTTGGKTSRPGSVWEDKADRLLNNFGAVR